MPVHKRYLLVSCEDEDDPTKVVYFIVSHQWYFESGGKAYTQFPINMKPENAEKMIEKHPQAYTEEDVDLEICRIIELRRKKRPDEKDIFDGGLSS
jgi:poly-D-alanine transfer protein DltD